MLREYQEVVYQIVINKYLVITVITGFSCIVSYISVISNEKLMVVIVLPIQILDTKLSRFRVLLICECSVFRPPL